MKKVILGALALSVLVMFSCEKERVIPNSSNNNPINEEVSQNEEGSKIEESKSISSINENDVIDEINLKTTDYLKTNNIDINQESKAKWWEVALVDIIGAGTGAAAAANNNSGIGGIIGAGVTIGSAASVGAAVASVDINNIGNTGIIYNSNNYYEGVGISHYILVDEALNGNSNWFVNNQIDYSLYLDRVFEVLKQQNFNCDNFKTCSYLSPSNVSNLVQQVLSSNLNLHVFVNQSGYSNIVKVIFNNYYQVMAWLQNYPSGFFANYSILVENIITNSGLNEVDKVILLSNMSTSRIGVQYWKS